MADERVTERTDGVNHERVVERGAGGSNPVIVERRGGGMGGVIALIIGLAVVALIAYFLLNMNRQEEVRTDAVSAATESVGNAAENVGDAARDAKLINGAINDLTLITGQKPEVRRARKSIAQFKLREGMPIGARVTLRGDRMWEFLDRLTTVALPRIRDFRGLSGKQFDGHGNYTFGLNEQTMFYEIDVDKVDRPRGMDITVVTTATNDEEGRALLKHLGFPFKEN